MTMVGTLIVQCRVCSCMSELFNGLTLSHRTVDDAAAVVITISPWYDT